MSALESGLALGPRPAPALALLLARRLGHGRVTAWRAGPTPRLRRVSSNSRPAVANAANAAPLPELARADWLIVGEPFGSDDDAQGGADQQRLLVNMLHAIGVARDATEPAKRAAFLPISPAPAVALADAFQTVQPRCVLVLGRAAAQAFLNADEPLGRLRERVHERSGVPVVVTFSLAYLLRHPAEKAKAWADLCEAVKAATGVGPDAAASDAR